MSCQLDHTVCVAPMIRWTDRHERYFLRLITQHALLYTEMITTAAILHGDQSRLLSFNAEEHPLALQLGGCDPQEFAACAKIAESYGYDEININVGCPSERVQKGAFGACLMREPELVAQCVASMKAVTDIPVTVKTRIGVDHDDSYEFLFDFVKTIAEAGCDTFIIHARKAWLSGLSPKQNREVPPLQYETVEQLKRDFPNLKIILNGGIKSAEQAKEILSWADGVMLGRAAYQTPYILTELDRQIFRVDVLPAREEVLEKFYQYVKNQFDRGVSLSNMTRHILGLYQGQPGAKHWRRFITEKGCDKQSQPEILLDSINLVDNHKGVYL